MMQVVGHKDGLTMMEQADPLVLLVGLPTIPIMLVLGKMLRWEDQALSLLRRHACKVPILRHFLPSRCVLKLMRNIRKLIKRSNIRIYDF